MSIHDACSRGDVTLVQQLLQQDPNCVDADDQHDWRPIFHAALHRHTEVVQLLLASGADVSAHEGYVLHYAAEVPNNKELVRLLVANGALESHVLPTDSLQRQFLTSVFLADQKRVSSLMRLYPGLVLQRDGRGDFPIHHAARNGDVDIVRRLIAGGADVNQFTARDHTVLYCAAGHGHKSTVQLLLAHGADVLAKFTEDQLTLLDWLSQFPDDQRFHDISRLLEMHLPPE